MGCPIFCGTDASRPNLVTHGGLSWRQQSPGDFNAGGPEQALVPFLTKVRLRSGKSDCNLEEIPFEAGVSLGDVKCVTIGTDLINRPNVYWSCKSCKGSGREEGKLKVGKVGIRKRKLDIICVVGGHPDNLLFRGEQIEDRIRIRESPRPWVGTGKMILEVGVTTDGMEVMRIHQSH